MGAIVHAIKARYLWNAVLIVIISVSVTVPASVLYCHRAYADSARSAIQISARVLSHFHITMIHQVSQIEITRTDIKRGYKDIANALHFEVASNNPHGYTLVFGQQCPAFKGIHARTGGTDIYIDGCQGMIKRPCARGPEVVTFSYRLILSDHVEPGTYASPVYVRPTDVVPDS